MSSGNNKGVTCKVCEAELTGKQTDYCGPNCKMRFYRAKKRRTKKAAIASKVEREITNEVRQRLDEIKKNWGLESDENGPVIVLSGSQRSKVINALKHCGLNHKPPKMPKETWLAIKRGPVSIKRADAQLIASYSLHGFLAIVDRP